MELHRGKWINIFCTLDYSHTFCKTVLIYFVHWIICFGTMMKLPIFISFKLLKLGCYIYNTPLTKRAMSGLQPNTPQPLAPSVPPLRKAGCCQWVSNSQPDL